MAVVVVFFQILDSFVHIEKKCWEVNASFQNECWTKSSGATQNVGANQGMYEAIEKWQGDVISLLQYKDISILILIHSIDHCIYMKYFGFIRLIQQHSLSRKMMKIEQTYGKMSVSAPTTCRTFLLLHLAWANTRVSASSWLDSSPISTWLCPFSTM